MKVTYPWGGARDIHVHSKHGHANPNQMCMENEEKIDGYLAAHQGASNNSLIIQAGGLARAWPRPTSSQHLRRGWRALAQSSPPGPLNSSSSGGSAKASAATTKKQQQRTRTKRTSANAIQKNMRLYLRQAGAFGEARHDAVRHCPHPPPACPPTRRRSRGRARC